MTLKYDTSCLLHGYAKDHICIKEDCSCIEKRYCQICADKHQETHNSKCATIQSIYQTIKGRSKLVSKYMTFSSIIEANCTQRNQQHKRKNQQALSIVMSRLDKYRVIQRSLVDVLIKIKERVNKFTYKSYIDEGLVKSKQSFMMKVNQLDQKGILDLHKMLVKSSESCSMYDGFFEGIKQQMVSKDAMSRCLQNDRLKDCIKSALTTQKGQYTPSKYRNSGNKFKLQSNSTKKITYDIPYPHRRSKSSSKEK